MKTETNQVLIEVLKSTAPSISFEMRMAVVDEHVFAHILACIHQNRVDPEPLGDKIELELGEPVVQTEGYKPSSLEDRQGEAVAPVGETYVEHGSGTTKVKWASLGVPAGTKLYVEPQPAQPDQWNAAIEAAAWRLREQISISDAMDDREKIVFDTLEVASEQILALRKGVAEAQQLKNPYSPSLAAENWQRGYNGERCIAAVGSAAHTYWKEGVAARKAKEATNDH